jgi:hypothetical protein
MIAFSPSRTQRFEFRNNFRGAFWFFGQRKCFAARELQNLTIAQRLGY